MKKELSMIILIGTLISCGSVKKDISNSETRPISKSKTTLVDSLDLYSEARKEYFKKNYDLSVELFEKFIENSRHINNKKVKSRIFWAIDLTMKVHLKINKDADSAIKFLKGIENRWDLNDAEADIISEWISVAKEWKKLGKPPKQIRSKEQLFELGEFFYNKAMDKIESPKDDLGNADFYIAATYLVPYVYNYSNSKNVGKALFMLGNIKFRSWNDYEYWTENYYLKEVIRRFPHSSLAQRAYKSLEEGVRAGYTGSAGESTPESQIRMLKVYKDLSRPKQIKKPIVY